MQEKLKNNKAITLVALVITIVIIIILSTIAINFTFGENGLITRAQQAAEMTRISQIQEQLEMAKGSAFIDGAGDIDPDHYFDIIEDEGIIDDKDTDVEDNEDGSYDVTTDGDYVFEVTPTPDGDLDIEYVGKNDEPRISSINVTDKTESSVSVEVVTKNVTGGEYTYSYKKTDESDWTDATTGSSDNTYTFSGLENNTSYDIKVTVKLDDGTTIEKTITVQVGETVPPVVEVPDGTITFGQVAWQGDGTANMPISTTELGYTLQYQVGSTAGQWTTITSGQSITGIKNGDTVYAKITDGSNDSEIQQTTVEDKILPEVNVTSTGNTSNSIGVSVSANDKESGMLDNPTYTYYIKKSNEESTAYVAQAIDVGQNTYTFSNLQSGVSYDIKVEVKSDKAGNMGTGYLAGQTTTSIPGGSGIIGDQITVSDTIWADGKASITVSTSSGYSIEYQINGTSDGSWTNIGNSGTVPNLNYGDTVNIRLTDGTNHGDFTTVTIGDEIPPTVNVTLGTSTSNSIAVSVSATDMESGMSSNPVYTYYIKESSEPEESYEAPSGATELASNTYTFAGLKQSTSYDIKVEVKADIAGNIGTGALLNQTTKTIPSGEGETEQGITFGTPIWNDGKASITVNTEGTEYSIEYKLSEPDVDEGWQEITNGEAIENLDDGSTVYARLTDGNNHGDYAQTTIKDEISPVVDVKLNGLTTSSSIPVTVTASDNESGMAASPTYTYYIKQSSEEDTAYKTQEGSTNLSTNKYTFTGLTQGTSYDVKVEVTGDVAGNTGTGYLAGQTTQKVPDAGGEQVQEGAITFGNISWSNNKASITVSTNTSYNIEYQVGAITKGSWIGIANNGTISNLDYGDMVYARLTDGVNHGEYASASIDEKIAPQAANISLSETSTDTEGSVTATVTLADNESGVDTTGSKWIYNTTAGNIGTEESSYTNSFTYNPEQLTLSANTAGTYYLHVLTKDIAGNKIETISEAVIVEQAPPDMSDAKPNPEEDGPEYGTNTPVQDDQGNTVVIPGGFHLDKDSGTSVEEGIVIEDGDGNQFVWIPTDTYQTTSGAKTNNLTRRIWASENVMAEPIEVSGDSAIGSYYGEGDSRSETFDQIEKFKTSVNKNKGFYIGRYEQGKGNVCKAGIEPYEASGNLNRIKSIAEGMYEENQNVVSELISSYAWDTALNFICQNSEYGYMLATTTDNKYGNIWTEDNNNTEYNTGEYIADNYSNIHDMLGNNTELTTEFYYDNTGYNYLSKRGGEWYNFYGNLYAGSRHTYPNQGTHAFRIQLYVK